MNIFQILLIGLLALLLNSCYLFANQDEVIVNESTIYGIETQEIALPSPQGAMAPRIQKIDHGFILSWLQPGQQPARLNGTSSELAWSIWQQQQWTAPATAIASRQMFSNMADRPSVFLTSEHQLLAHWLEKSSARDYGYEAMLAKASLHEQQWQTIGPVWQPEQPTRNGYDGFVSLLEYSGKIRAFWIDGRFYQESTGGKMRLLTAEIAEQVENEQVLDANICSCCDTAAINTPDGPIVFYRGRSDDEIRDILRIKWESGKWSQPSKVADDNWHIAGCTVDGPQVASVGEQLVVVWFTGAGGKASVRIAFSDDAGQTFSASRMVDNISPFGPIGRSGVIMLENGDAIVSWIGHSKAAKKNAIWLRRISPEGAMGPYVHVNNISNSRLTGFLQMSHLDGQLYINWTEPADKAKGVSVHEKVNGLKMLSVRIDDIPVQ